MSLGEKIAARRRELGITQQDFADRLYVTRQTVSRWEQGTATPDVETVVRIAGILGVTCDFLLRDGEDAEEPRSIAAGGAGAGGAGGAVSRLLQSARGRRVKFAFFDGEADVDLFDVACAIQDFEGSWMRIVADTKKGPIEKLIPVSSVLSIQFVDGAKEA